MTLLVRAIPVVAAVAGMLAIGLWLRADASFEGVTERLQTQGRRSTAMPNVGWPGHFEPGPGAPSDLPGVWPNFRGPNFDGVSPDPTPLARSFPAGGPKVLWAVPVGIGYAAPAIRNGRVYLLDYDEKREGDALRCLSLADGREIWRRWYPIPIDSVHGISRTIPAVTDKYVVTFGPKCHVMCVDAATGDFRWGIDLVKEYGAKWPKWYAGQCPLIEGDLAILAPAGPDVLLMAVDCATGKVVWKTPNRLGWKMTHGSITPLVFKARRMYVYCGSGGVVGVSAEDVGDTKAGDIVWQRDDWQVRFANVPSPVVVGEGRLVLTGGYGAGAMMIQLREQDGKITSEMVWRLEKSKEFGSEQQTPVFFERHLYAALPKEAGSLGGQLVCLNLEGQHAWTSGPADRFGLGPVLVADGMIFAMDDNGNLTLAEASAAAYKPLAKVKVVDGHETWAPLAIAGGRLIVRDLNRMVCIDLRKE